MAVTSQLARNLRTVLAQMADQARGDRIRELRVGNPELTQQKIVDGLEKLAGTHVVTLRGYQEWEKTGGLRYENAGLLARFHGVDTSWIWKGETAPASTPELMAQLNGQPSQLDRIEAKLDLLLDEVKQPSEHGRLREQPLRPDSRRTKRQSAG